VPSARLRRLDQADQLQERGGAGIEQLGVLVGVALVAEHQLEHAGVGAREARVAPPRGPQPVQRVVAGAIDLRVDPS
jgi:hypothetical protein